MVIGKLVVIAAGMSCLLLAADEAGQKTGVTKTERMDFPAGGVLHVKHSIGELTVEGWDQPGMEITTIKSPRLAYDSQWREKASHKRELDETHVTAERHENEVAVTTTLPHRSFLPPWPLRGGRGVGLDYQIKIPRNARLVVEHGSGEVHVEGLTGDLHVTVRRGEITVRVPQEGEYAIDARSSLGDIVSDFPGSAHRRPWLFAHRFAGEASASAHKVYLRTSFGDIIILKIRQPAEPAAQGR